MQSLQLVVAETTRRTKVDQLVKMGSVVREVIEEMGSVVEVEVWCIF